MSEVETDPDDNDPRIEPPRRYLVIDKAGTAHTIAANDLADAKRKVPDATQAALLGTHESTKHGLKRLGWG